MKLGFLITLVSLQGTHAFTWTSDLEDDADVFACVGDRVSFPWNYSVEDGELVEDIKWYYDAGNGSRKGIAATVEGEFFPLRTSFSDRIGHVKEAGLSLASVSGLDKGHYSVTVTVFRGSSFTAYTLKASLIIAEDPLVLENEALWARQERVAVYDNTTGQLHVRLSCGKYVITGHPPVFVEWTFPSGDKHLTSKHMNGSFIINLPNPVEGGNYTCRLSSELPPVSCLPHNASVLRSSSVSVDDVKMRLSLLEAEQEILKTEKQTLQTEVKQLKEENRKLSNLPGSLQQVRDYITERDSNKVRFVARPAGVITTQKGQPIIFSNVTMNEGNAFSVTTGLFTAPFNGTYFFVLSVYQDTTSLEVYLSDGVNTFCTARAPSSTKITCEAAVYRTQGEKVWCYFDGNYYYYYNNNREVDISPIYSSFIGFSLDSDIQNEM